MSRIVLLLSLYVVSSSLCGQELTYYLLGRPNSFEFNNALRDVGRSCNILFQSSGSDVYDQWMDAMQRHNDSVSTILTKTKGENWYADILQQANEELKEHNALREKIKREEMYLCRASLLAVSYLLIERKTPSKRKSKKYKMYLVGTSPGLSVRKLETVTVFCWNGKRFKVMDSESRALPFSFPANGIN